MKLIVSTVARKRTRIYYKRDQHDVHYATELATKASDDPQSATFVK